MTHKELAIRALTILRGDDAERARSFFSHFTPEEMQQQHGESGLTRAQLLAQYEETESRINEAIKWVAAQG